MSCIRRGIGGRATRRRGEVTGKRSSGNLFEFCLSVRAFGYRQLGRFFLASTFSLQPQNWTETGLPHRVRGPDKAWLNTASMLRERQLT